jgi:hypothetical protein
MLRSRSITFSTCGPWQAFCLAKQASIRYTPAGWAAAICARVLVILIRPEGGLQRRRVNKIVVI